MVAFVAPWCGHCKNLGPEYTAAAQSLSPLIPFYAIDCDASVNKPLCAEHQIKGFPTIKAFPRAGKGAARDYNGERKKGALVEYAKGLVPDRVKKLRADDGAEKVVQAFLNEVCRLQQRLPTCSRCGRNQNYHTHYSPTRPRRPYLSYGRSSVIAYPARCVFIFPPFRNSCHRCISPSFAILQNMLCSPRWAYTTRRMHLETRRELSCGGRVSGTEVQI